MSSHLATLRLVVFDWAGTTVDHGCFGPVAAFIDAFAARGVALSVSEARAPMGLEKKDHLRALTRLPAVAERWRSVHGRSLAEADVEDLYTSYFVPRQLDAVRAHCRLIPGLLASVDFLRSRGITIATTTGYFRTAAEVVYEAAREQGYAPDVNVCPSDVSAGRPAPWMIFRAMAAVGAYPPAAVHKVGDTVPDVEEGRNAGARSVGVARTGSAVGCTEAEWAALPRGEQEVRLGRAKEQLLAAGAHCVIDSVADVPAAVAEVEGRLRRGERP
jgi:phosphonoacetaldehyde hydrolase